MNFSSFDLNHHLGIIKIETANDTHNSFITVFLRDKSIDEFKRKCYSDWIEDYLINEGIVELDMLKDIKVIFEGEQITQKPESEDDEKES